MNILDFRSIKFGDVILQPLPWFLSVATRPLFPRVVGGPTCSLLRVVRVWAGVPLDRLPMRLSSGFQDSPNILYQCFLGGIGHFLL
jgi:hypothetical protein